MNYFFIYHLGHGGGNWLMLAINNHPHKKMWVLGEVHQPCQLDFAARGIEETPENKTCAILYFFEDAESRGCHAAGIIKSFTPAIRKWGEERGARFIQMVRNPLSKMGKHVRLDRMVQAGPRFEAEFGRLPETYEEKLEAHFLWARRKFYDHFMRDKRAAIFPLVRLEDINKSMHHSGKFFARVMEWLTQTEWPQDWVAWLRCHSPPNQVHENRIDLKRGDTRYEIDCVVTNIDKANSYINRTTCFAVDPESMICWEQWGDVTRGLYKKYFADVDRRLGYNQEYPSSVSQDWEWAGEYEWGGVYDGETTGTRLYK